MAVARLRFLDRNEEDLLHEQSIRCLERIGVMVKSEAVLKSLELAGAKVDLRRQVAKLPESLVMECVKKAPKEIAMGARDPRHNKSLPVQEYPLLSTTGLAVYTKDMDTSAKRPTTNRDLANFSRIADAMDGIDVCWTTVTAHDVVQNALALNSLWTAMQNNTKHVQVVPATHGAADARKQVELASLVVGGPAKLKRNPIFSVISCSIAPLCFERAEIEAQAEFAKAGIPVVSMSMSISGLSSPVTMAGTLENINAENLASNVITQVASPGAPFIYSSESAPMDMKTGVMDYNAYHLTMLAAGAGQMAKRYGFPAHTSSWGLGAIEPGIEGSLSEAANLVLNTFSDSDMMSGAGSLDYAKGAALEQVVLDSHVWEDIRNYMRKFVVNKETIALDVTETVGHGGTFLRHPHTLKNFKSEMLVRDQRRKHWQATLSTKMSEETKQEARKTLKEHVVPELPKDVLTAGAELVRAYERQVCR